jgi:hypothetical protein
LSQPEVQAAFRAGLAGRPFREAAAPGLAEAPASWATGPNESLLDDLDRLPGLHEPRAAYAAGRALRRIMQLFDQAGAPAAIGRQFLDNLHAAVTAQAMRDRRVVWGGSDTVAMFMEMYARILGDGADFAQVESALLEHALSEPGQRPGRASALLRALRRRRRG